MSDEKENDVEEVTAKSASSKRDKKAKKSSPKKGLRVVKKRVLTKSQLTSIRALPGFKGVTDRPKPGTIHSRLSHSATISYEGRALVIPPRAQGKTAIIVENFDKLGALPTGVNCLEMDLARQKERMSS